MCGVARAGVLSCGCEPLGVRSRQLPAGSMLSAQGLLSGAALAFSGGGRENGGSMSTGFNLYYGALKGTPFKWARSRAARPPVLLPPECAIEQARVLYRAGLRARSIRWRARPPASLFQCARHPGLKSSSISGRFLAKDRVAPPGKSAGCRPAYRYAAAGHVATRRPPRPRRDGSQTLPVGVLSGPSRQDRDGVGRSDETTATRTQ